MISCRRKNGQAYGVRVGSKRLRQDDNLKLPRGDRASIVRLPTDKGRPVGHGLRRFYFLLTASSEFLNLKNRSPSKARKLVVEERFVLMLSFGIAPEKNGSLKFNEGSINAI